MFNQQELKVLVGGVDAPVDLDDMKRHTHYGGVYDESERTIELFWKVRFSGSLPSFLLVPGLTRSKKVVKTFNQDQRRALLRFVTSCSRPPLLWVSSFSHITTSD